MAVFLSVLKICMKNYFKAKLDLKRSDIHAAEDPVCLLMKSSKLMK